MHTEAIIPLFFLICMSLKFCGSTTVPVSEADAANAAPNYEKYFPGVNFGADGVNAGFGGYKNIIIDGVSYGRGRRSVAVDTDNVDADESDREGRQYGGTQTGVGDEMDIVGNTNRFFPH